jgi:hypothetical protein
MTKQIVNVPIPRTLLKPEDLKIDEKGAIKIDKALINKLVKENINVIPDKNEAAISVGVVVEF